ALTRLSEILPIRYREQPTGAVDVFSDSDFLVLGNVTQQLEIKTTSTSSTSFRIELSKTGHDISRSGGELRGVIEGRDDILGGFLNRLDEFASTLISEFNRFHSSGEGFVGYESILSQNPVFDSTVPLNQESAGLVFTPQHGSFDIKIVNQQTGIVETTTIPVDLDGLGADSSLEDIRATLNGIANLSAVITPKGELQLNANAGYEFRFSKDTSGLLSSLGMNTFFSGTSAGDIDVSEILKTNSDFLGTGQGDGPSDGSNLVGLLNFLEEPVATLNSLSLTGFYEQTVSQVAHDSASESALSQGFETFRDSLRSQQQQFTGVSLDEEAIKVLELQRSYQAAARIVTTVNELFAVLLNL
ncbi:MAG: flagellar hook-associated protein FlgK, partial [Planctomycetaceae bacterium]|nr:flagellar hook-associated protein FlgK [Planctomycetaceae bacterium]